MLNYVDEPSEEGAEADETMALLRAAVADGAAPAGPGGKMQPLGWLSGTLGQLPDFKSDFQSNCWVSWEILGRPCEFQARRGTICGRAWGGPWSF